MLKNTATIIIFHLVSLYSKNIGLIITKKNYFTKFELNKKIYYTWHVN